MSRFRVRFSEVSVRRSPEFIRAMLILIMCFLPAKSLALSPISVMGTCLDSKGQVIVPRGTGIRIPEDVNQSKTFLMSINSKDTFLVFMTADKPERKFFKLWLEKATVKTFHVLQRVQKVQDDAAAEITWKLFKGKSEAGALTITRNEGDKEGSDEKTQLERFLAEQLELTAEKLAVKGYPQTSFNPSVRWTVNGLIQVLHQTPSPLMRKRLTYFAVYGLDFETIALIEGKKKRSARSIGEAIGKFGGRIFGKRLGPSVQKGEVPIVGIGLAQRFRQKLIEMGWLEKISSSST